MKLYGKNSVLERLKTNPRSIRKIYIQQDHKDASYIRKKAKKWGIAVFAAPKSKIQKVARSVNAQGVVVEVEDFPYIPYDELLESALKKKKSLLFLDGLNDPQNLGGIIRSLACFGSFSIVLPTHKSVGVTEAVLRVACGGDNYVPVARVSNLAQAIGAAKAAGFWIAGAVVTGGRDPREVKLPFPFALVLGSEHKGIRDVIQKKVDLTLTIPMAQSRMSLNVAQAAALFCCEITRQRGKGTRHKTHDTRT